MLAGIVNTLAHISMNQAHKRAGQKELAKEFVDLEITRFNEHINDVLHEIELMEKDLFMYCNVEKIIPEEKRVDIEEHMILTMKKEAVNSILKNSVNRVKSKLKEQS